MKQSFLKFGIPLIAAAFFVLFAPKVHAATLYLSPGSGNFSVGSTINVVVEANTQGAAVNTAEARINFSSATLELVSVRQGSTFYLTSPGSPAKTGDTAFFSGGLPTPGYNGNGGVLGTMTFRAKAEGSATVSISSGKVLLNDGNGTDAFTSSSGARFTIAPPPVGGVTVSSTTHPNPDAWYAKSNVELSWNRPGNAFGFSFELDQSPTTTPDSTLDTTVTTTKSYTDLKDGTWYFHIRARPQAANAGFGATTHFKIQIDTTGPEPVELNLSELTVSFKSSDATSGIDHYELLLDNKVLEKTATSPYTLSNLQSGDHKITVKAYDKAGNTSEAYVPVSIAGIGFFNRTLQVPLYLILLLLLLILILIMIILILWHRKRKHRAGSLEEITKLELELKELNKEVDKKKTKLTQKIKKIKKEGGLRE